MAAKVLGVDEVEVLVPLGAFVLGRGALPHLPRLAHEEAPPIVAHAPPVGEGHYRPHVAQFALTFLHQLLDSFKNLFRQDWL